MTAERRGVDQEGSTARTESPRDAIGARLWIVMEALDYNSDTVSAVYPSEELATTHVEEMGGWVVECDVRADLHPDVTDPAKQQARRDEKDGSRKEYEARRLREERDAVARANVRPHDRMGLCHCVVFSGSGGYFINAHGYCGFCGGFVISVFRQHCGEPALQAEIDKLAIHDRERMRHIAAATP